MQDATFTEGAVTCIHNKNTRGLFWPAEPDPDMYSCPRATSIRLRLYPSLTLVVGLHATIHCNYEHLSLHTARKEK